MRQGRKVLGAIAVAVGLAFLAGCGGGGGGGGGTGGTGGTVGTSAGTISGFGSVIVNGVKYSTTGATVKVDDSPSAAEDNLRVGMYVKVRGRINDDRTTGAATSIEFEDALEGPVQSIDVAARTFVAMGRSVFAGDAIFEGATFETLTVGNVVEVTGPADASGVIRATRIEKKADAFVPGPGAVIEAKGTVASLDTVAKTFALGAMTVDYNTATLRDLTGGALANGQLVEVKSTAGFVGGLLVASDVQGKPQGFGAGAGDHLHVEGYVTAFNTASSFSVAGQAVVTNSATQFLNGVPGDIALNVEVEVEGSVNSGGVLVATKVKIRRPKNARIEGNVSAVNAGAKTLTVSGVQVGVDAFTQFKGNVRTFAFANIQVGDRLEVRGAEPATGTTGPVLAAFVERKGNPTDPVVLQGKVSTFDEAAGSLSILGVSVAAAGAQFRDQSENAITSAAFFGSLTAGATLVKAKGAFAGGSLTATEVQLEGEPLGHAKNTVLGEVTRFGSIFVNGVELSMDGAVLRFDDRGGVATAADLKEGMRVRVEAELNDDRVTGQAVEVEFEQELQGPMDDNGIDLVTGLHRGEIRVMKQRVKLDDLTVLDSATGPMTAAQLINGHIVEVSGFRDAAGVFHATRIDDKGVDFADLPENEQEFELKGEVSALSTTNKTFQIGAQVVDYSTAALPAVALANGLFVEVKSLQALANGVLVASSVRLEDNGQREAEGVEVELRGLVTGVGAAGEFEVQGQSVQTTEQTLFEGGTLADIALGRLVEVEGVVAGGVLVARKVGFEHERNVKIEGFVDAGGVDLGESTVTILGITVKVDGATRMRDKSAARIAQFSLADISAGDRVSVRAFLDAGGSPVAARLDRDNPAKDRVILQGPADSVSGTTVNVLGALVDTATIADNRFRDAVGNNVTRDQFLALAVQAGNLVKFRGTGAAGAEVIWERAEIELRVEFPDQRQNGFEFESESELD